jgi:protein-disulfide isomerase
VILMLCRMGVEHGVPYILVGLGVCLATLASGVHATVAGVAVGVVGAQGKFWEMYDLLMGNGVALRFEDLLRCASQIGADVERFEKDLTSRRHALHVVRDTTGADDSGVGGTPTFSINGRRHHGAYDLHSRAAVLDLELHSQ